MPTHRPTFGAVFDQTVSGLIDELMHTAVSCCDDIEEFRRGSICGPLMQATRDRITNGDCISIGFDTVGARDPQENAEYAAVELAIAIADTYITTGSGSV